MSQRLSCPVCGDEWKIHCEGDRPAFDAHVSRCEAEDMKSDFESLEDRVRELEERVERMASSLRRVAGNF
jgi:uncharacterized protein CbrC (UPF0167 family)